ncbi:ABC transporter substrate-binding protein, partial [bacterium]|nr:ABC transporter substrate-binding protein [bacterium]
MNQQKNTILIVGIAISLIVGAGIGSYVFPQKVITLETVTVDKIPLDGQEVRFGYMCSNDGMLEFMTPFILEMVEKDINEYAEKMNYDISFKYLVETSSGQAALHLEKVQAFKSMDINIVVNSGSSGQVTATLPYVDDNNMLLWSATSTSPLLAFPDDNLFRMIPTDLIQAPALAKVLDSYGIKAVVVIQRSDSYGDGIYNFFEPAFGELGGVVLERIRYQAETQEFSTYNQLIEEVTSEAVLTYGIEHVGILLIGGTTSVVQVSQIDDYPTIRELVWFGSDSVALEQRYVDDATEQSLKVKLISTLPIPGSSEKYWKLAERYKTLTGLQMETLPTNTYDIAWVLMNTVLQQQSVEPEVIIPVQADFCYNFFGASGWTKLNEDDDRAALDYNLYAITEVDG